MTIWVKNQRRDGKFTVVYSFDNGVRLTKILTKEKLAEEQRKTDEALRVR